VRSLLALLQLRDSRATTSREEGRVRCDGFERSSLVITGELGDIPAFLFLPLGSGPFPAVLVHHQHSGEWHLGKSEVAGLAGDPLQAFAPELARRGMIVLCADVISFEDRRAKARGIAPDPDDWLQHYNACAHRLVTGDLLMRAIVDDAMCAVDVLRARDDVASIGALGHSMGGTIALWHAAIDHRVAYVCASGCVASFARRIADGTGISMLELIPGIAHEREASSIVAEVAPRPLLIVSADEDRYSADAPEVVAQALGAWPAPRLVQSLRAGRGHDLDRTRFDEILRWVIETARAIG